MSIIGEVARKVYEFIVDYNLLDKGDEVGLLLSLGKDSIALLEILNYLNEKFNLNLNMIPIIVVFPKHKYSKINLDEVKKLLENAHIIIPPYDDNILKEVEKPCAKCKLIRRTYILKSIRISTNKEDCNSTYPKRLIRLPHRATYPKQTFISTSY